MFAVSLLLPRPHGWTREGDGGTVGLVGFESRKKGADLMASETVVRNPGEGEAFWMLGGLYEVKAASAETNGEMTVMEMTLPSGMGPPPHTHPGTESVYVLEGRLRYHIGGETFEGGPGSFFHIPEGVLENFEPVTDSRVLVIYTPGGIENFFADAGERAERREVPPAPSEPPDIDRLMAIGRKYGMEIRPPTPA
jgi:quercetin dioxygenase-like cupin family protein